MPDCGRAVCRIFEVAFVVSVDRVYRAGPRWSDTVRRTEPAKLIASFTRVAGDVGLAEDLTQDAFVAALERAETLGGALGPYALQAAIAACHARARTAAETD